MLAPQKTEIKIVTLVVLWDRKAVWMEMNRKWGQRLNIGWFMLPMTPAVGKGNKTLERERQETTMTTHFLSLLLLTCCDKMWFIACTDACLVVNGEYVYSMCVTACVGMFAIHMCWCMQAHVSMSSWACGLSRGPCVFSMCCYWWTSALFILGWLKFQSQGLWIKQTPAENDCPSC